MEKLRFFSMNAVVLLFSTISLVLNLPLPRPAIITPTPRTCPSTTPPAISSPTATQLCWSYSSLSVNEVVRMINGNGRKGYRIGLWNCRRGLITEEKNASRKLVEVQQFIQKKSLHILCLVESDLHS